MNVHATAPWSPGETQLGVWSLESGTKLTHVGPVYFWPRPHVTDPKAVGNRRRVEEVSLLRGQKEWTFAKLHIDHSTTTNRKRSETAHSPVGLGTEPCIHR